VLLDELAVRGAAAGAGPDAARGPSVAVEGAKVGANARLTHQLRLPQEALIELGVTAEALQRKVLEYNERLKPDGGLEFKPRSARRSSRRASRGRGHRVAQCVI
jgi:hypothetical protein